jgi:hypothetical protein
MEDLSNKDRRSASPWAMLLAGLMALPLPLAAACSTGVSTSLTSLATLPDGAPEPGGGSCPCVVGNSGLQFTIGCGDRQCLSLNGQAKGYHCTTQGAVDDPTICTNPPPSNVDAGPCGHPCVAPETCGGGGVANFCGCTPKSCAELGNVCGAVDNGCKANVTCPGCEGGLFCNAASRCAVPASHVIVIGNYQGGTFAINVDQDLPNIGIGLVSYEAMHVTISGAHAANVVAVVHAGYSAGTTVSGVSPDKFVDVQGPQASPDGGLADDIIDDIGNVVPGMHPTSAEIADYFVRRMGGGALAFHECQYGAYSSTVLVSGGGSCK